MFDCYKFIIQGQSALQTSTERMNEKKKKEAKCVEWKEKAKTSRKKERSKNVQNRNKKKK